jgi:hypothetical protein
MVLGFENRRFLKEESGVSKESCILESRREGSGGGELFVMIVYSAFMLAKLGCLDSTENGRIMPAIR